MLTEESGNLGHRRDMREKPLSLKQDSETGKRERSGKTREIKIKAEIIRQQRVFEALLVTLNF